MYTYLYTCIYIYIPRAVYLCFMDTMSVDVHIPPFSLKIPSNSLSGGGGCNDSLSLAAHISNGIDLG